MSLLLSLRGVSKRFPPAVQALAGAHLDPHAGEVHALVGGNGAGKSTLSRIIAGLEQPESGSMQWRGQAYRPGSRREAEQSGVRMVMQELNLVPTLTVAENIFLDTLPRRFGIIQRGPLNQAAAQLLGSTGLHAVAPDTPVGQLGIGQQQLVEIARGLSARCDLLILDEPTAALTHVETQALFAQIQHLLARGTAVLYISHRLEEILQLAHRITVLRDGAIVGTFPPQTSVPELIRLVVGRTVAPGVLRRAPARPELALRVANLRTRTGVRDLSLELHRGEILGLAGLMGSGRTETLRAIFGADPLEAGALYLRGEGTPAGIQNPADAVRAGMAFVTEDRKGQGLLLPATIRQNISLASLGTRSAASSSWGVVSRRREDAITTTLARQLGVRAASIEQPVSDLSGGNQQKVVMARWLMRDASILLLDEPTRGIDIGARFEIYQLLADLAGQGKALLVVSSELPELQLLCHRIAVLSKGKLVQTFTEFDSDAILRAAFSEYAVTARP